MPDGRSEGEAGPRQVMAMPHGRSEKLRQPHASAKGLKSVTIRCPGPGSAAASPAGRGPARPARSASDRTPLRILIMCWCGRTLPSWASDRRTVEARNGRAGPTTCAETNASSSMRSSDGPAAPRRWSPSLSRSRCPRGRLAPAVGGPAGSTLCPEAGTHREFPEHRPHGGVSRVGLGTTGKGRRAPVRRRVPIRPA